MDFRGLELRQIGAVTAGAVTAVVGVAAGWGLWAVVDAAGRDRGGVDAAPVGLHRLAAALLLLARVAAADGGLQRERVRHAAPLLRGPQRRQPPDRPLHRRLGARPLRRGLQPDARAARAHRRAAAAGLLPGGRAPPGAARADGPRLDPGHEADRGDHDTRDARRDGDRARSRARRARQQVGRCGARRPGARLGRSAPVARAASTRASCRPRIAPS